MEDEREIELLCSAAREGHHKVVELLIQVKGIDINLANQNGDTLLCIAARNGQLKVMETLLTKKKFK